MADRTLEELNAIVEALEETYPLAGIKATLNEINDKFGDISDPDFSDLSTSLATLTSLVTALPTHVDTALADGLADIDASVTTLETAVADLASSADVASLGAMISSEHNDIELAIASSDSAVIVTALGNIQADLQELLAQSDVYHANVVVNTPASLDALHAIGSGLAIVNGYVDIDVSTDMDIAKVQELVNFIQVTTGDFAYTAFTGVDTEITFNNLVATKNLTIDQEGGYSFASLESATVIVLDDDSSVTHVRFPNLRSVNSLSDGTGEGTFTFARATELILSSLPRSPHTALSLGVDTGGVIDISSLVDTDFRGEEVKLNLTLDGPTSVTLANLSGDKAGSTITATNIKNLTINGYGGRVTIGENVQNFTSDNLASVIIQGNDLVTFNATGVINTNPVSTVNFAPALTLSGQGNLETVSVDGIWNTVTLSSNGNLVSATISGEVQALGGVDISSNSDLVNIDVSGLLAEKLDIDGNSDLETLTIDFVVRVGSGEGTIIVNNNESLESLVVSTNNVDNLTITNNVKLKTIDGSGLTSIGTYGTPRVTITDNAFNASESRNLPDGASAIDDVGDGAVGDLGSFTTTSGMDTLETYLTAVAADADSTADVKFDTVDTVINSEGAISVEVSTNAADVPILTLTPKIITQAAEHPINAGYVTTNNPNQSTVLFTEIGVTYTGDDLFYAANPLRDELLTGVGQTVYPSRYVNGIGNEYFQGVVSAINLIPGTGGTPAPETITVTFVEQPQYVTTFIDSNGDTQTPLNNFDIWISLAVPEISTPAVSFNRVSWL